MNPFFTNMVIYNPTRQRGTYVRVFHAVPDAPAVDVYANDMLIFKNIPYKAFSQYLKVPCGTYSIKIYPSGQKDKPVLTQVVEVEQQKIITLAAVNRLSNISLLPIIDSTYPYPQDKLVVKFGHLSPDAPNVDITLPDGTVVFGDVAFGEVTPYIMLDPGTYSLQARVAGTDQVVLEVPEVTLLPDREYSIYAVGFAKGNPPLEVVVG